MRAFIYACEMEYEGLHGMNRYGVVDVDTLDEVVDIGTDWSEQCYEDYGTYDEDCSLEQEIIFYYWKVRNEFDNISTDELNRISYDLGDEEFVEKYCEEWDTVDCRVKYKI